MQYISALQAQRKLGRGEDVQPGNWFQDGRYIEGILSRVVTPSFKMHPTNSKSTVGKRYNKVMRSAKKGEVVASEPSSAHVAKKYMSEAKKSLEINRLSHIAYKANAGIKILEAK
jgi:hypothetical protein